jgi:3-phosphoshikimate 1-carboxyvinyltransferase
MVDNLTKMGAFIKVRKTNKGEDLVITGTGKLHGARVKSFGDHRTAMSMAIAGIAAVGVTQIKDFGCTSKSFPGFFKALKGLIP